MTRDTISFTASDGTALALHRWIPDETPVCVIQLAHGMTEYAMRYDRFARDAVGAGFAVYAPDMRGHGETAGSLDRLGHLADRHGFERVVEDHHELTTYIDKSHPGIPVVLFGQSFGSFIAQRYIELYGDRLAGCIIAGSRGPDPLLVRGGSIVAALVAFFRGGRTRSPFLDKLTFGTYNARIPDAHSARAWLSRDGKEVELYDATPWAGFVCTSRFYCDMLHGLSLIHTKRAIAGIPEGLHVLVASGTDDPVSSYGKTVAHLADLYRTRGMRNVRLVLYPGARHELLNETNRAGVTADILGWIQSILRDRP